MMLFDRSPFFVYTCAFFVAVGIKNQKKEKTRCVSHFSDVVEEEEELQEGVLGEAGGSSCAPPSVAASC
jgi:hypothetical protein